MANFETVMRHVLKEFPKHSQESIHGNVRRYYIVDDNNNRYMISVVYGTMDRFLRRSIHLYELDLGYKILGYVVECSRYSPFNFEFDYMCVSMFNKRISKSIINDIHILAANRKVVQEVLGNAAKGYRIYRFGDITIYLDGTTAHAVRNGVLL